MPDSPAQRYSTVAIALHWLIAALIIGALGIGLTFPDTRPLPGLKLHYSLGITAMILSVLRLIWRATHPPPDYAPTMKPWETWLARWAHRAFYVLIIATPLTGWMKMSAYEPQLVHFKLFDVIPWPNFPFIGTTPNGVTDPVRDFLQATHKTLGMWILGTLLLLHVAAIVKHHLFDRDPVLRRMLPRKSRTR